MSDYEADSGDAGHLKKGQNLIVQAINSNGAPLTLPLPLAEFAKAYDGPPTDPKVFEETRRSSRKSCRSAPPKRARSSKLPSRPVGAGQSGGEISFSQQK